MSHMTYCRETRDTKNAVRERVNPLSADNFLANFLVKCMLLIYKPTQDCDITFSNLKAPMYIFVYGHLCRAPPCLQGWGRI
jgi:hypothetical protein